jgi:hypothetical protein
VPLRIALSETFGNGWILGRKRVALSGDVGAKVAQPRDLKLKFLDVRLLAMAMGSITRSSECTLDAKLNAEPRTSALACSSQPRGRRRALF